MEETRKEKLLEAGVDIDTAMERFMGREDLLVRFLKKFHEDGNYEALKTSVAEKRYEDAFKAAHALKGLCGNLSLTSLFNSVHEEVEFLRGGQHEEAEKMLPGIVAEYERVVAILDEL